MGKNCYCCGSSFIRDWIEWKHIDFDYKFYLCGDCGYAGLYNFPDEKKIKEPYKADYYDERYSEESNLTRLRKIQYKQDIRLLKEITKIKRFNKILDFGSGTGAFISLLPGQKKLGVEINKSAIKNGLYKKNNIPVYSSLEEVPEKSHDLVTMRGVIEHLPNPIKTLKELYTKVEKGGYFYICATPDNDSPSSMIYREKWNQFYPPHHPHQFSRRSLTLIMAKIGFQLISYSSEYLNTPYSNIDNDGKAFINDARNYPNLPLRKSLPYPGTMLSMIFLKS